MGIDLQFIKVSVTHAAATAAAAAVLLAQGDLTKDDLKNDSSPELRHI